MLEPSGGIELPVNEKLDAGQKPENFACHNRR
jgi:hypothetical protein